MKDIIKYILLGLASFIIIFIVIMTCPIWGILYLLYLIGKKFYEEVIN